MTIYQNLIAGSGFLQGPKGDTGPAANTAITTYKYVATAGQTTFSSFDSEGQILSYVPTGIIVVYNGATLNPHDEFTATNGTSITLNAAANAGDEVNIITFPPFAVANTYTQVQTNTLLNAKLNLTGGTLTGNVIANNVITNYATWTDGSVQKTAYADEELGYFQLTNYFGTQHDQLTKDFATTDIDIDIYNNIICQKIRRGEKYSLNPVSPKEENMKDNKIIQNLDILIDEEEDEEQKAWLQLKRKIHLLKTRREC